MNDKVVQFPGPSNEEPHFSGPAMCLHCRHKWVAVAPVGTTSMECPGCRLSRGEFIGNARYPGEHYICRCQSDVFRITRAAIYCARCGLPHRPFDDDGRRA